MECSQKFKSLLKESYEKVRLDPRVVEVGATAAMVTASYDITSVVSTIERVLRDYEELVVEKTIEKKLESDLQKCHQRQENVKAKEEARRVRREKTLEILREKNPEILREKNPSSRAIQEQKDKKMIEESPHLEAVYFVRDQMKRKSDSVDLRMFKRTGEALYRVTAYDIFEREVEQLYETIKREFKRRYPDFTIEYWKTQGLSIQVRIGDKYRGK